MDMSKSTLPSGKLSLRGLAASLLPFLATPGGNLARHDLVDEAQDILCSAISKNASLPSNVLQYWRFRNSDPG
ncbi:hypothetical protein AcV5_007579 [Taiwanofungus camphoratus]|nr:hypothetical protein AcW2_007236 [Antrodia cinnamomea]KAI0926907.1 hypothetical protein AcV5_007579 [Antrodia cinnamomea]KAI0947483.1 hypothetical protein AcV7_009904 [Antrodia cinnamomea]